jgi:hypothetical protein
MVEEGVPVTIVHVSVFVMGDAEKVFAILFGLNVVQSVRAIVMDGIPVLWVHKVVHEIDHVWGVFLCKPGENHIIILGHDFFIKHRGIMKDVVENVFGKNHQHPIHKGFTIGSITRTGKNSFFGQVWKNFILERDPIHKHGGIDAYNVGRNLFPPPERPKI